MWVHEDSVIQYLTIDGEIVVTTPNHPFKTGTGQWLPAGELQVGDTIYTAQGGTGIVETISFVYAPQPMYNLTVATAHTYFVGDGQWLVHNRCDFGHVKFRGLVRNRNLTDLTDNQLSNAFRAISLDPSTHFIQRLKDPRATERGVRTLAHVERIFNKGVFIDQGDGTAALLLDRMAIIYNLDTKKLITLTPWNTGIP